MYIISMLSLFKLRRTAPGMVRPFSVPVYPFFPAFALASALVCMGTMISYNALIFAVFAAFMAAGFGYFLLTRRAREAAQVPFETA
jgi:ethanolamine permease